MFDPSKCHSVALNHHGGSCCGISHIYSFPRFMPSGTDSRYIKNADEAEMRVRFLISKYWADSSRKLTKDKNRLYEAVLEEKQRKQWEPVLLNIGFECVSEFTNTNSNHRVYVYHYLMGPKNKHGPYKSPYKPEKPSKIPNPFKPQPAISIPF